MSYLYGLVILLGIALVFLRRKASLVVHADLQAVAHELEKSKAILADIEVELADAEDAVIAGGMLETDMLREQWVTLSHQHFAATLENFRSEFIANYAAKILADYMETIQKKVVVQNYYYLVYQQNEGDLGSARRVSMDYDPDDNDGSALRPIAASRNTLH